MKTPENTEIKTILKHYLFLFFILIILSVSCISSGNPFDVETETEIVFPFLQGTYTLGDLFYHLGETDQLTLEPGVFYRFTDTIPFENPLPNRLVEKVELIFRSGNIMPFQVDLLVSPFDSVASELTGEPLFVTLVEAAWVEFDGLSIQPVRSENTLLVDQATMEILQQSNSLILELDFIWPYEKITTSMFEDYSNMYAFQLQMILKINL